MYIYLFHISKNIFWPKIHFKDKCHWRNTVNHHHHHPSPPHHYMTLNYMLWLLTTVRLLFNAYLLISAIFHSGYWTIYVLLLFSIGNHSSSQNATMCWLLTFSAKHDMPHNWHNLLCTCVHVPTLTNCIRDELQSFQDLYDLWKKSMVSWVL